MYSCPDDVCSGHATLPTPAAATDADDDEEEALFGSLQQHPRCMQLYAQEVNASKSRQKETEYSSLQTCLAATVVTHIQFSSIP